MEDARARLRELPSVDEVMSRPAVRALEHRVGRAAVKAAAQKAIAAARQRILAGSADGKGELVPDEEVLSRAQREAAPRLRRVINATGVVLHTNLGRAPLHPQAIARVSDYAVALDAHPHAVLLRVHRSNFALIGFTQEVTVAELASLGRERSALVLHDLGSGALQLPEGIAESTAARSLADGADLVMVSGDKLLGGPQAGILLGRREPLDLCRRHPLARALRADRMLLAALEATLQLYRRGRAGELPINAALGVQTDELSRRATRLALDLQQRGISC